MTLDDWMRSQGLRSADVARRLDVHHTAVSRWLASRRLPCRRLMMRIVLLTQGAVQPRDFYRQMAQHDAAQNAVGVGA